MKYVLKTKTIRSPVGKLLTVGSFNTFREAVIEGQQTHGYGMFHVECGMHVPTREEQLLQLSTKSERQRLLEEI